MWWYLFSLSFALYFFIPFFPSFVVFLYFSYAHRPAISFRLTRFLLNFLMENRTQKKVSNIMASKDAKEFWQSEKTGRKEKVRWQTSTKHSNRWTFLLSLDANRHCQRIPECEQFMASFAPTFSIENIFSSRLSLCLSTFYQQKKKTQGKIF